MKQYFEIITKKEWLMTLIIGVVVFSLILVFTLNLFLAFFSLVIFSSLGVFQRSFHNGLAFFLAIILIFSYSKVGDGIFNTVEIFILILAFISMGSLFFDKYKFKISPLFYYWMGVIILFGFTIIFSENTEKMFYGINKLMINKFIIALIIYPIIISAFQYFFQTTRRIERFFLTIILVGTTQAVIGGVLFNGFFETGLSFQGGGFDWSMLLVITIPITLGMLLIQKNSLSALKFLWFKKRRKNINKIVDIVLTNGNDVTGKSKKMIVNLRRSKLNVQGLLVISLILQVGALVVTLSYIALIATGIGVFIIGVLMRSKRIISVTLGLLLVSIILLPGFEPTLTIQLKQILVDFLTEIKNSHDLTLLWRGVDVVQKKQVESAYFLIFNQLGLVGLGVFVLGLVQYFREIRSAYLKSDDFERAWLIVILGIFIEVSFLGILSNIFFIWPVALLFWLLYGILQNLKNSKKEYRLIETRLEISR